MFTMDVGKELHITFKMENLIRRAYLGTQGVDKRIILKWILHKLEVKARNGMNYSIQGL
jgi:hypothetical protein